MDRLEAMSILVAVAEAGSLSAAGRRLHLPLTTVSRKVAELEAHLGSRLLNRSTRRPVLRPSPARLMSPTASASWSRWTRPNARWAASTRRRRAS